MSRIAAVLLLLAVFPQDVRPQEKRDELEKNIDRALKFLRGIQRENGAWQLNGESDTAATSLAVMAFLSAGHVPGEGPHGPAVEKGIRWVLAQQQESGFLGPPGGFGMYQHGISTLMLAEAVGMTDDAALSRKISKALEKAVRMTLQAQRRVGLSAGGWRYSIDGNDADVSVTGWQLLSLKAAKNVGCDVPADRIYVATAYLRRSHDASTGGFAYQPGGPMTVPCTGTAILCLELCDKHHAPESLRAGAVLLRNPPAWGGQYFCYDIYYGAQATFQLGGNYWAVYRPRLHKLLFDNQRDNGSWEVDHFGPAYSTAMGVLALTVEYRYLPIYQRGDDSAKEPAK
jgi:hypothetical protein